MMALLLANFMGFAPPDMKVVYLFFAAIVGLFFFLIIVRGIGRLREKKIEKESAWKTFRNVAKARGLTKEQIQALAHIAQETGLQRPAQIVGSVGVFDRSLDQTQAKGALDESQLLILEQVRQKLVTTAEIHDEKQDRRQLERVPCALRVSLALIAREDLEQELRNRGGADEEVTKVKLKELALEGEKVSGQVTSISAGGVAVMVGEELEAETGDFVGLAGGSTAQGGLDLSEIWGEIRTVRKLEEQAAQVLHLRFMGCETEKKREIIQLVYRELEEKKEPSLALQAKARKKQPRKKKQSPQTSPTKKEKRDARSTPPESREGD